MGIKYVIKVYWGYPTTRTLQEASAGHARQGSFEKFETLSQIMC